MNVKDRATARALYALTRGLNEKQAGEAIDAFVALLAKNGRLARAPKILEAVEAAAVEEAGGMEVELTTAAPITDAAAKKIAKGLETKLGGPVLLRRKTDPALIGGAVVRAGELLMDASVRRRLETLEHRLAE